MGRFSRRLAGHPTLEKVQIMLEHASQPQVSTITRDKPSEDSVSRGRYGEIITIPDETTELLNAIKDAAGWKVGIEGLRRFGGFEARSIDVYGYDTARDLAVVQLRRTFRKNINKFMRISKVYALIGRDDGQLFSHVLESSPRRVWDLQWRTPESVVRWAEKIIFGLRSEDEVDAIKRQGDIALVPIKALPKDAVALDREFLLLRKSHKLVGKLYETEEFFYVVGGRETRMTHLKHEHGAIYTTKGQVFRVVAGRRGDEPWWTDAALGD